MTSDFQPNYDLQPHNSLAVPSSCRWYMRITDKNQLSGAVAFARDNALPLFILGAGTNLVLGSFIDAVVIEMAIPGKAEISKDQETIVIEVGAGENWHQFVVWTLQQQFYGLENLALIPGTCGAAPIQNIGAYGMEISELIESVEVYDTSAQSFSRLSASDCEFAYRDSIFKRDLQNQVVVVAIQLKLQLAPQPKVEYPALIDYIEARRLDATPENIFGAVCAIRRSKLPDPEDIPNVGSFFKNPILDTEDVEKLQTKYPEMPIYDFEEGQVKVPAAWLIDHTGWKGWLKNGIGVHDQQALVLVNPGRKPAAELLKLAEKISANVLSEFGIELEMEPRVIG